MAGIGGIIGAGIFRTPAVVAERVRSPALIGAVWILGGLIALIGAFCYGELAARRPRAGGGYVYLRDLWGPLPAFLYGWALLLVIATGAIAAVAVTFADYALALAGISRRLTVPVAVGAIVLLSGVNYVGVRPGSVTQNVLTLLKLAALAALIAVGLGAPLRSAAPPPAPAATATPSAIPGGAGGAAPAALGAALVAVVFTDGGWQQTNFIAEEIVEPERKLPRALGLGVAVVIAAYLLTSGAARTPVRADSGSRAIPGLRPCSSSRRCSWWRPRSRRARGTPWSGPGSSRSASRPTASGIALRLPNHDGAPRGAPGAVHSRGAAAGRPARALAGAPPARRLPLSVQVAGRNSRSCLYLRAEAP